MSPTPFYGGYNLTQRNFEPVQFNPRTRVPESNYRIHESQSNNDILGKQTNATDVNMTVSFSDSVIDSFSNNNNNK